MTNVLSFSPLKLRKDKHGKAVPCLANAVEILDRHSAWTGVIAYDEFRERVIKTRPPPSVAGAISEAGEWRDVDSIAAALWLESTYDGGWRVPVIDQAVEHIADQHRIHPLRDWLTGLQWDGAARLDPWLATYCGAEDTAYTRGVGSRWCISAVARVMRPGCQVDCTLVLEGEQGRGKSSVLRTIAGEEWFSDTPPPIGDKDGLQQLRGVWVIELAELASLKGREVERTKAFLSARTDTYRPSYARRTVTYRRQCVFAASTNESYYLADRTGNRRFWPVKVGTTNVAALAADRDALWAEAVHRYRAGEPWHADTQDFRELCAEAQEEREIGDSLDDALAAWLADPVIVEVDEETGMRRTHCVDHQRRRADARHPARPRPQAWAAWQPGRAAARQEPPSAWVRTTQEATQRTPRVALVPGRDQLSRGSNNLGPG